MHTYWIILISTPNVPICKFKYQIMFDHYADHYLFDHYANMGTAVKYQGCLIIVQITICLIMMQILYNCQRYNVVFLMHNSKMCRISKEDLMHNYKICSISKGTLM